MENHPYLSQFHQISKALRFELLSSYNYDKIDNNSNNRRKVKIMKRNMGTLDRTIRFVLVVLVAVLYFTNVISGTWAIVLGILAVVFLITSLVGVCPLYMPFGISTRKKS